MDEQQRENQVAPCNRDNCVLCALSARVHLWRDYGLWNRSVESVRRTYRRISESVSGLVGTCGHKVRAWAANFMQCFVIVYLWETLGLSHVYQRLSQLMKGFREFVEQNTTIAFFIGGVLLIFGTFLFVISYDETRDTIFNGSFFMIFLGGVFIWIPVYFWMFNTTYDAVYSASIQDSENCLDEVLVDEPPRYSTVITDPELYKVAPPAYDEVCHNPDHYTQQQISDAVTLCSVHQPLTDNCPVILPSSTLTRSRSLGDLSSREALLP